jgi:hypothetical protein
MTISNEAVRVARSAVLVAKSQSPSLEEFLEVLLTKFWDLTRDFELQDRLVHACVKHMYGV